MVNRVGLDFLLRKKSSVPRGSKNRKQVSDFYSLTRQVEPNAVSHHTTIHQKTSPFGTSFFGEPNDLNLEPIIDELRELHRILYIPSTYGLDVHAEKTTTFN